MKNDRLVTPTPVNTERRVLFAIFAAFAMLTVGLVGLPLAAADGHCGLSMHVESWSPTTAEQGEITFQVVARDDPEHCGIGGRDWYIDGEKCEWCGSHSLENGRYTFTWTTTLTQGSYTVTLNAWEGCCFGSNIAGFWKTWTVTVGCNGKEPLPIERQPTGIIRETQPLIQARFRDLTPDCGPSSVSMRLNGDVVDASTTQVDNDYIVSYHPPSPLEPGTHSVVVEIKETPNSQPARASWSFTIGTAPPGEPIVFDGSLPTARDEFESPSHFGLEQEKCFRNETVCVGPFYPPFPVDLYVGYGVNDSAYAADADPYAWGDYGPYGADIPTPLGVLPVWICKQECFLPAPTVRELTLEGTVWYSLRIQGQPVSGSHPIPALP